MRLPLFDARGHLVRVLQDGALAEGRHTLHWNGKTDVGQQAASGLYLVRARGAGGATTTQRMTLVK